jgi:very-short-patch-repair endonuclease
MAKKRTHQHFCIECQKHYYSRTQLTYHLKAKHNIIDFSDYCNKYPEYQEFMTNYLAEVSQRITDSLKARHKTAKENNYDIYIMDQRSRAQRARDSKGPDFKHSEETKLKMSGPRPKTQGVPKSAEHIRKLSDAARIRKRRKHTPNTIIKMQDAWIRRKQDVETYDAYINSLRNSWTLEKRQAMSIRAIRMIQNNIVKKSNTLPERKMKQYLEEHNIEYIHQYAIEIKNVLWLFDFYIPELHLLVEIDGEYWHTKTLNQINRDNIKQNNAMLTNFSFVRISDSNLDFNMIYSNKKDQMNYSKNMVNSRKVKYQEKKKLAG